MTPMTPERLAEIKAKHAAATKGPFHCNRLTQARPGDPNTAIQRLHSQGGGFAEVIRGCMSHCDGEFYAASWQDVADLIAEVERLRAENAASKSVAQWAQATLTALNGGDVQRESLLHQKLREVMIQYRAALDAAGAPK